MNIIPAKNIAWQSYDGAIYVSDERTGTLRKLEDAGYILWQLLETTTDYEEILNKMLEIYSISMEELEPQLISYIHELETLNILEVTE